MFWKPTGFSWFIFNAFHRWGFLLDLDSLMIWWLQCYVCQLVIPKFSCQESNILKSYAIVMLLIVVLFSIYVRNFFNFPISESHWVFENRLQVVKQPEYTCCFGCFCWFAVLFLKGISGWVHCWAFLETWGFALSADAVAGLGCLVTCGGGQSAVVDQVQLPAEWLNHVKTI